MAIFDLGMVPFFDSSGVRSDGPLDSSLGISGLWVVIFLQCSLYWGWMCGCSLWQ